MYDEEKRLWSDRNDALFAHDWVKFLELEWQIRDFERNRRVFYETPWEQL